MRLTTFLGLIEPSSGVKLGSQSSIFLIFSASVLVLIVLAYTGLVIGDLDFRLKRLTLGLTVISGISGRMGVTDCGSIIFTGVRHSSIDSFLGDRVLGELVFGVTILGVDAFWAAPLGYGNSKGVLNTGDLGCAGFV